MLMRRLSVQFVFSALIAAPFFRSYGTWQHSIYVFYQSFAPNGA